MRRLRWTISYVWGVLTTRRPRQCPLSTIRQGDTLTSHGVAGAEVVSVWTDWMYWGEICLRLDYNGQTVEIHRPADELVWRLPRTYFQWRHRNLALPERI